MKSTYALGYLLFSLREIEDTPLAVGLIRLTCTNSEKFAMRGLRVAKESVTQHRGKRISNRLKKREGGLNNTFSIWNAKRKTSWVMTPARCMRNLQLLPKIGVTYVYTAAGRRQKIFTAVSNVSGLVKESAYLTNLSPGVGWLALTEGPRL